MKVTNDAAVKAVDEVRNSLTGLPNLTQEQEDALDDVRSALRTFEDTVVGNEFDETFRKAFGLK